MNIVTKQDFVKYTSILSEFQKELLTDADLVNFDFSEDQYADENILWNAAKNLPKFDVRKQRLEPPYF